MKGYLYSQDGGYAFPLGPKVTTIGRENCDISITSPQVDNQHALIEYDDEQRCFILKDLNSSSGTYVHDCRVQNAAVRLADGDFLRFGFNGLPLQFRIEHQSQESAMPSIYPRQSGSNSLQMITQTIPSRKLSNTSINNQQQIDVQQNPGFSLRTRALSAGTKKISATTPCNQTTTNSIRESIVRPNAFTFTTTSNAGRTIINGSFSGEVDLPNQDNTAITNRVSQLEKEVKGREAEIRELTERLRNIEPLSSTFKVEVQHLKGELDKVKREKQSASSLVSSLQRDLHSKESNIAKLTREIEGLKIDGRDKDLRLQSLQSKFNLLRDRSRAEEERHSKEKELKIKAGEQQINELNETINRLKSQLQDAEKQLLRFNQNEQKLKQECEQAREHLAEIQRSEATLKTDLSNAQRKHNEMCINIWRCFAPDDDNDEYDEDQHNIIEKIQELQQQLNQHQNKPEEKHDIQISSNDETKPSFEPFIDIFTNAMQEQTTERILLQAEQQMIEFEITDINGLTGMFKKAALNAIHCYIKLFSSLNSLIKNKNDQEQDLYTNQILTMIRNQCEEFERERGNVLIEQSSREQALRSELEQITAEKEVWQQRFDEECNHLHEQMTQLQREHDEQSRSLSYRLEQTEAQNNEYIEKLNMIQRESNENIEELTSKLQEYQQQLTEEKEQQSQLSTINERQNEKLTQLEKEKNQINEDLNGQIEVYKDQVRQFSITIIQLEKKFEEEYEKKIKLQTDLDNLNKKNQAELTTSSPSPTVVEPVVPILTAPVADLSQELFAYKARVQEQEQIIISLRRDLAGMTARLSDVQGELSEKQKQALEKSELTIREQLKELNDTRVKLSKLSDIVDKQSAQIEILQSDLSKSKVLIDQYQLLIEQRQSDIDRLTKHLQEKDLIVEQVERTNQDEGRITHELISIGAQCKGERHEQTIARQREALNELRARIKSLEQLRPVNPAYEKVLQQVVLLKRELAELRARQALPTDIPELRTTPAPNLDRQSAATTTTTTTTTLRQSPSATTHSEQVNETQKIVEERAAHAETMNSLQSYDELYNTLTRKLVSLLEIDDDSLLNATPLTSLPATDRYIAFQQRQRTSETLIQKVEMLRERLTRKEDLLRDYEKDLGKLRQAEILLREKDVLLKDLEADKRTKDDEALYLRNALKETQDNLNQEKRINSSVKLGRNLDQSESNEFIRRSGGSTSTLHHHCPPDTASKIQTVKRDMNQKISRKNHEIKTLKQELHEALDTISEQSHKVKLLELQTKT